MAPNALGLGNRLKSLLSRSPKSLPSSGIAPIAEENITRYCRGGYHPVRLGDSFNHDKYKVIRKLGFGVYSTVWLAFDNDSKRHVALKILTADTFGTGHDTFELDILRHLKKHGESHPGTSHVLHLLDEFTHQGPNGNHSCLVFRPMGPDMSRYRRLLPKPKIPVQIMKKVSRQLLLALSFLHDTCRVIHTDIKPHNILIETPAIEKMFQSAPSGAFHPPEVPTGPENFYMPSMRVLSAEEDIATTTDISVRLADFGTSSWFDNHLTDWIQPDMLRAPEVILEAGWDHKVDIWNLGIIIWELTEGKLLFDGSWTPKDRYTAEAHLAQMTTILGDIPEALLNRSSKRADYFDSNGRLLEQPTYPPFSLDKFTTNPELAGVDRQNFLSLISSMVTLNPEDRPEASELLNCAWLPQD